jgi:hypothetical protein
MPISIENFEFHDPAPVARSEYCTELRTRSGAIQDERAAPCEFNISSVSDHSAAPAGLWRTRSQEPRVDGALLPSMIMG